MAIKGKIVIEPVKSLRISYVNPGSDEEDAYTYKGRMYHTASRIYDYSSSQV